MSESRSPNGWKVLAPQMLRVLPRGMSGSHIAIPFDAPLLPDAGRERVRAELGRHLAEVLPQDPAVAKYLTLRDNLKNVRHDLQVAETAVQQLELDHKRLLLEKYSPGQAQRMAQLDAERRSAAHTQGAVAGVAREMEKQLEAARKAAEGVLIRELQKAQAQAITQYSALIAERANAVAALAGPALDALAEALQGLAYASTMTQALVWDYQHAMEEIQAAGPVPVESAPAAVPPVETPPSSAPVVAKNLPDGFDPAWIPTVTA